MYHSSLTTSRYKLKVKHAVPWHVFNYTEMYNVHWVDPCRRQHLSISTSTMPSIYLSGHWVRHFIKKIILYDEKEGNSVSPNTTKQTLTKFNGVPTLAISMGLLSTTDKRTLFPPIQCACFLCKKPVQGKHLLAMSCCHICVHDTCFKPAETQNGDTYESNICYNMPHLWTSM